MPLQQGLALCRKQFRPVWRSQPDPQKRLREPVNFMRTFCPHKIYGTLLSLQNAEHPRPLVPTRRNTISIVLRESLIPCKPPYPEQARLRNRNFALTDWNSEKTKIHDVNSIWLGSRAGRVLTCQGKSAPMVLETS